MIDELNPLLANIMFNPLSWIHDDYHPARSLSGNPAEIALLNTMFIDLYQLPVSYSGKGTRVESILLRHWQILPVVALLLCSFRYRDALIRRGHFIRLPQQIWHFAVSMPGQRVPVEGCLPDIRQLTLLAPLELLAWQHSISTNVFKRLTFMFPLPASEMVSSLIPTHTNLILLEQAIQYAQFGQISIN